MGDVRRRLAKLEGTRADLDHHGLDSPESIRDTALHANACAANRQEDGPFEVVGDVVRSSRDGRLITDYRSTLADPWYWEQLGWHEEGLGSLVHDAELEAFFTPDTGELALSRTFVHLGRLWRWM